MESSFSNDINIHSPHQESGEGAVDLALRMGRAPVVFQPHAAGQDLYLFLPCCRHFICRACCDRAQQQHRCPLCKSVI